MKKFVGKVVLAAVISTSLFGRGENSDPNDRVLDNIQYAVDKAIEQSKGPDTDPCSALSSPAEKAVCYNRLLSDLNNVIFEHPYINAISQQVPKIEARVIELAKEAAHSCFPKGKSRRYGTPIIKLYFGDSPFKISPKNFKEGDVEITFDLDDMGFSSVKYQKVGYTEPVEAYIGNTLAFLVNATIVLPVLTGETMDYFEKQIIEKDVRCPVLNEIFNYENVYREILTDEQVSFAYDFLALKRFGIKGFEKPGSRKLTEILLEVYNGIAKKNLELREVYKAQFDANVASVKDMRIINVLKTLGHTSKNVNLKDFNGLTYVLNSSIASDVEYLHNFSEGQAVWDVYLKNR